MKTISNAGNDLGLLVIRFFFGGSMLISHGLGKLLDFQNKVTTFPDPLHVGSSLSLGLTIFAEVVCATAILLGFATRWAAIPLMVSMSVAAFIVHGQDPFQTKELAFAYLAVFASLFVMGPGRFSFDGRSA